MLNFDDIEAVVFKKSFGNIKLHEKAEKAAKGELEHIFDMFKNGDITKAEAGNAKQRLRAKYEQCISYTELMKLLKDRFLKAYWDFKPDKEYIEATIEDMGALYDIPEAEPLYQELIFAITEYFDNRLAEPKEWKDYRKEMAKLKYLLDTAKSEQLSLDSEEAIAEQRKKVMARFMEYAFYQINRGYPKMSEETAKLLLDMPSLWNRLFDLAKQGELGKIDNLLAGLRMVFRIILSEG